jgi:PPOX class probable FMN-dependent enzyme
MSEFKLDPDTVISDERSLRSLFPPTHTLAAIKSLGFLDRHAREFIARSPFLCIGTQGAEGMADVSPRGDPAGFVRILDRNRLAIPDRPGNNRLDTLANILQNPSVGLLFLVPGFDDTLRINGKATLTTDPDLLDTMKVRDRAPGLAIVVEVREVFMHCAKAFRRSGLWNPERFQDRAEMPSLMEIILDQTTGAPEDADDLSRLEADLEADYKRTLY